MLHKNQIIVWLLAGFLMIYHTLKIYNGLVETPDAGLIFSSGYYQNTVRLLIVFSLMLVVMFSRLGLVLMWLSIVTLIVIQYISLSSDSVLIEYFSPLKGLIIPFVITWIFWRHNNQPEP